MSRTYTFPIVLFMFPWLTLVSILFFDIRTLLGQFGGTAFLMIEIICFLLLVDENSRFNQRMFRTAVAILLALQYLLVSVITFSVATYIVVPLIGLAVISLLLVFIFAKPRGSGPGLTASGLALTVLNIGLSFLIVRATGWRLQNFNSQFLTDVPTNYDFHNEHSGYWLGYILVPFQGGDVIKTTWWLVFNLLLTVVFFLAVWRGSTRGQQISRVQPST